MTESVHPIQNEREPIQVNESQIEELAFNNVNSTEIDDVELGNATFSDIEFDNTKFGDTQCGDTTVDRVLGRYFRTLNDGDFQATAQLFEPTGALKAPFESEIIGREAIANYLNQEAKNLHLTPLKKAVKTLETGEIKCRVGGKVNTPLFSVNVAWNFILNSAYEIRSVEVKLLAALEDLLKMKNTN